MSRVQHVDAMPPESGGGAGGHGGVQSRRMETSTTDPKSYRSFADFYPYYLSEHSNRTCRRLHFVGSTLALLCLLMLVFTGRPQYLLYALLCGYGFAWVGHYVFEKNRPATFKRPLYSFMGDWVMYKDIWTGRIKL